MPFRFSATELPGMFVIEPVVFPDERGFFVETYKQSEFAAQGIAEHFVQGNQSRSSRGTLRGLHFQNPPQSQAKLIRSLDGEIYDVVVDIRRGSPSYGKWQGLYLSAENSRMLYVPAGFAHGFCVVSEMADISYMTSAEYAPALEGGIIWDDADLKIPWPINHPQLSKRDRGWPRLREINSQFHY
ncbi:MAG: dTDP-4-dehydrorhamnose 3,5-epimerase [Candidatus Binatia bacterium]